MASLRKLRRRLLRWDRYAQRYGYPSPKELLSLHVEPMTVLPLGGHCRAWDAVEIERERRWVRAVYWPTDLAAWGIDPPGSEDDWDGNRCCNAGDDGHPGPCATTCDSCGGDGRCPGCGGLDDLGCDECGGSLSCPECWGAGEHVEDVFARGSR